MTSLQIRFPQTFAECEKYIKKYSKYESNIIINKGIRYNKNIVLILSDDEIKYFIDLQIKHSLIINDCFNILIEILEQREKQIITKKIVKQNNPMKKIYDLLISLNEHKNLETIDKWVLFIKSQNEFSKFF